MKIRNINFKQTKSERSATRSYSAFSKIRRIFGKERPAAKPKS